MKRIINKEIKISECLVFADDNEANPFDVDFSFDEVPIGLTENNMNNDDVDHQVGCVKGTDASFIRTRQAFFNGTPNAVAMVRFIELYLFFFFCIEQCVNIFATYDLHRIVSIFR